MVVDGIARFQALKLAFQGLKSPVKKSLFCWLVRCSKLEPFCDTEKWAHLANLGWNDPNAHALINQSSPNSLARVQFRQNSPNFRQNSPRFAKFPAKFAKICQISTKIRQISQISCHKRALTLNTQGYKENASEISAPEMPKFRAEIWRIHPPPFHTPPLSCLREARQECSIPANHQTKEVRFSADSKKGQRKGATSKIVKKCQNILDTFLRRAKSVKNRHKPSNYLSTFFDNFRVAPVCLRTFVL